MKFSLYADKREIIRTIIWSLFAIGGLIIIVIADMTTSDWFFFSIGSFVLMAAGIGFILGCMGVMIILISGREYAGFAKWAWSIFLFCFLEMLIARKVFHYQETQTFQKATPIVHALENYYKEHGNYPPSLQILIPDYFFHIPSTKIRWGTESFWYEAETHKFSLMFLGHVMSICSYTSDRPKWECHGT